MRRAYFTSVLLLLTGCPASLAPYSKPYQGDSDAERKSFADARRDVYPDERSKDS